MMPKNKKLHYQIKFDMYKLIIEDLFVYKNIISKISKKNHLYDYFIRTNFLLEQFYKFLLKYISPKLKNKEDLLFFVDFYTYNYILKSVAKTLHIHPTNSILLKYNNKLIKDKKRILKIIEYIENNLIKE